MAGAIITLAITIYLRIDSWMTAIPIIGAVAACLIAVAWFFFRRTQCNFSITCADTNAVEQAHAIISKIGRGITITATDWRHEIDSATVGAWAIDCIKRANARSELIAKELGVRVAGVFSYDEEFQLPDRHYSPKASPSAPIASAAAPRRRASFATDHEASEPAANGGLTGADRGGAQITIRYRIQAHT